MLLNLISSGGIVVGLITFVFVFSILVFCLTIHEYSHAWVAFKLGDPTAKAMGRLTLNPLAHLDPVGTLLLLLVGFGWGKPVPFNPNYFSNPRRSSALVSLAGPASNFIFAVLFGMIHKFLPLGVFSGILEALVYLNLILCFFNLIPIHPLDGFKIVWGFLPPILSSQWMDLAPYGIYFLLMLIFFRMTDVIVSTPVNFFLKLLL